ncbi:MAG: hypothetical protein ACI909_003145 [Planctomycetota bacterium]|jgi:hypothetical protein
MRYIKIIFVQVFMLIIFINQHVNASSTLTYEQLIGVKKTIVDSDEVRELLQKSAVLLANYEILAKKLVRMTENGGDSSSINIQANQLLDLSETVIDSARFRLPQCDEYLNKSMALRENLKDISHKNLEKDYHHDGALPKAPAECYHAKDLFVHPATVLVLTRDDPSLGEDTRNAIKMEITEVLGHTELVRQLVLF